MTLRLTPETMAAAYTYLQSTPPFDRWNLPEAEEIRFKVVRDSTTQGLYWFDKGKHGIYASTTYITTTGSLMALLGHELIHLHQCLTGMPINHNAGFKKLADRVCRIHGFDRGQF